MRNNRPGSCWRCGHPLQQDGYAHDSICPGCRTSTRVCRNCRFFDTSAPYQCTEPSAEKVLNKQSANHCGYFQAERAVV